MMGKRFSVKCRHEDQPHTVWFDECNADDIEISMLATFPVQARFDNRADAVAAAERVRDDVEAGRRDPTRTTWIKVFRSDNEQYVCWRWPQFRPNPVASPGEERE